MFKKLIEYSSLFALLGFFLHYLFLWQYYSSFGIDILLYTDFTDILTSVSTWLIFPILFLITIFPMIIPNFEIASDSLKINLTKKNKPLQIIFLIFFIILLGIHLFTGPHQSGSALKNSLNSISLFLVTTIMFSLGPILLYNKFYKESAASPLLYIVIMTIALALGLMGFATTEVFNVRFAKAPGKFYCFKYDNRVIQTDSTICFIGQTKSALFLYNRQKKNTTIYKTESIDSLVVAK